ncbi:MAG: phosphoribosylglycinamide formyltransferase [Bacteroidetes bacterium]|nr:phosphoribosylglycinamide formyltransferase [Bacteroidota bacterium]
MASNRRFYHIAIIASGTGSNAKAIVNYFKNHDKVKVSMLLSNRHSSGVVAIAEENDIPCVVFNKEEFNSPEAFLPLLKSNSIDFIILAGFLWLVPIYLVDAFENRIINIHPSLLPKYGGKGMFGMNVHRSVFENHEKKSGLTIHLVNKEYDKGEVLFQQKVDISDCSSPNEIADRILEKEHHFYPAVIEKYILSCKEI